MIKKIPSDLLDEIMERAERRREIIRSSDTDIVVSGRRYYVSSDGDDHADGRSPDKAWASINRVNRFSFRPGDAVFFRRGDIFRGSLIAREGMTYSAYGTGEKPRIWASPFDGAKYGAWHPTGEPDIYVYSERFYGDVGSLFFNHGAHYATKATVHFKKKIDMTNDAPFSSWRDLRDDLSFYHDLGGSNVRCSGERGLLYLKCKDGNPAERFRSIEFNVRRHGITVKGDNVRINNLHVEYCGMHGVAANLKNGLSVGWCRFDHIGGSMLFYDKDGRPTRFGNAVEIYGSCKDYTVEHCHINDIYDTGITHQFCDGENYPVLMRDITYKGNLIENCIFSIEYYNGASLNGSAREIRHVRIVDNILLNCGQGFGEQRRDKGRDAHIMSWSSQNLGSDMKFENNIFFRSRHDLLHITSSEETCLPVLRDNLLVQDTHFPLGYLGITGSARIPFSKETIAKLGVLDESNLLFTI